MTDLNKYIGKPYELGARGPDAFDCWGLVMAVYRDRGIELPDWNSDTTDVLTVANAFSDAMDEVSEFDYAMEVATPKNFDIAIVTRSLLAHHVGIYVYGGILHVYEGSSKVCHESFELFRQSGKGQLKFYRWKNG